MPGASIASSISGLTNTLIGAGMLALPHAYTSMGWCLGSILLVFCATTTNYALYLMKLSCDAVEGTVTDFYDLVLRAMPSYVWVIDLTIGLKCWGVTISYLIISGNLMPQVLASVVHAMGFHTDSVPEVLYSKFLWTVLVLVCISPFCFVRQLHSMSIVGYINMGAVAYLLLIMTYFAIFASNTSHMPEKGSIHAVLLSFDTIRTFPIMMFAYTCAQNIISVYRELDNCTLKRANTVTVSSVSASAMVYLFVGLVGYATFGSHAADNIISMYPDKSLFVGFAKLAVVFLALTSYPVQLYPSRASFISLWRYWQRDAVRMPETMDEQAHLVPSGTGSRSSTYRPLSTWSWNALTLGMMLSGITVALAVDDLSIVLGFVGSIGSSIVSFILPSVIYCCIFANGQRTINYSLSMVLGAYGVIVMIVALAANINKLLT